MEFGYSSSASSSPDPQVFALPLFDQHTDSSAPTSPDSLAHMMYYNSSQAYPVPQYTISPEPYEDTGSKSSIELQQQNELDAHDRRRKRPVNAFTKESDSALSTHLRRRAQNRASQRAFRERKEKHLKGLEAQLSDLHEKHQDLLRSYNHQADEMAKLHARIAELTMELDSRSSNDGNSCSSIIGADKFDSIPISTMVYPGSDFYFDKAVLDLIPDASSKDNDIL